MPKSLLLATLHMHGKPLAYSQGYAYHTLGTGDLHNPKSYQGFLILSYSDNPDKFRPLRTCARIYPCMNACVHKPQVNAYVGVYGRE